MKKEILMPKFGKRPVVVNVTENGVTVERVLSDLVTVVAQDHKTGEVLMVAYTNKECYLETLLTGKAVYYSTSRLERWLKGETSGDVQLVRQILVDCDGDTIIYRVEQTGQGACHTGSRSCFYRDVVKSEIESQKGDVLLSYETPVHESFLV